MCKEEPEDKDEEEEEKLLEGNSLMEKMEENIKNMRMNTKKTTALKEFCYTEKQSV